MFAIGEHTTIKLAINKTPLKRLAEMQPAKARAIRKAIARVAADPSARQANFRPLAGVPHGFRIRVGDWRVAFTLDRKAGVMEVFEIEPRGGAYR